MPINLSPFRLITVLILTSGGVAQTDPAAHTTHSSFQAREAQVMPFDLTQTRHIFERTAAGGVQRVVALKANDKRNIALIRGHLQTEAVRFAKGNFGSPAFLHGESMDGLALLQQAARTGRVTVRYTTLPTGAALTYQTKTPAAVKAIHAWFAAQMRDHGGRTVLK